MGASTSADPGRIFISYRREDSAFPAGWLYDRLCARFGRDYVFKDVDSIDPGDDFLRVVEDAVGSCQVLLALIGDRWLDITNGTGHRRLDDPNDFVRLEIEAALRRDVRVIPILVGRAPLPSSEQPAGTRPAAGHRTEPEPVRARRGPPGAHNRQDPGDGRRWPARRSRTVAPVDRTSRWEGPATNDRLEAPAEGRDNLVVDPDWISALSAFQLRRWAEAVDRLEGLEAHYPRETRIQARLEKARRQRDIAAWSSKAETAAAHDDWDTAVTALKHLSTLDPSYPEVAARLEQAQTAQQLKALVDDMTALHQAGRWEAVVAAAQELARRDPGNPDPGGIVSDARAKLRDAELAERYAQAINHLDQQEWQQAADLFAAIEQEHAGYREAAALLTTAQRQCDLTAWSDQAAAAAGQDDWGTALTALEKICAVDPTYQDAGVRLKQARSAQRLRTLVDEVTALHETGCWTDVLSAADELAQLDPDNPDPGGMISDARLKVREAELADRYGQGVSHLEQQLWAQAVEVFGPIEQEQPGYRDTTALLRTAQQSLAAAQEAEAKKQAAPPPQNPPVVTHVKSKDHGGGEVSLSFADRPLTDLNALIDPTTPLSREQQHQILDRLQAGLRSDDREQRTAQRLLGSFSSRDDLYKDVA